MEIRRKTVLDGSWALNSAGLISSGLTVLAATLIVGCGPSTAKQPITPPTSTSQEPQPALPIATPTADDPVSTNEDPREVMMSLVLEKARTIQDDVAALRGLPFLRPVPAERQDQPTFRKFASKEIRKYYPADKSANATAALHHIGIIQTNRDLVESALEVIAGQVAAYYHPETGRFYAVSLSDDIQWLEIMTAHELVHGLQDQHFDLRAYVGEPSPKNPKRIEYSEDQLNARRFVVEGEATFVMFMYGVASAAKVKKLNLGHMLTVRMVTSSGAKNSWRDMVAQADLEASKEEAKGKPPSARLSKLPPYIVVPTLQSYTLGAEAISVIQGASGWSAVADLYKNPPESTEQMLHPKEKLIDNRDMPTAVVLPDYSKRFGKPLFSDTLGELGWRVYLETWKTPAAELAAAGWDGDAVSVYKTPDGLVGLLAFVWDTTEDAVEWENALRRTAKTRTVSNATRNRGVARYQRADGKEILVSRKGRRVFVVDGSSGKRALTFLGELTAKTTFR